MTELIEQSEKVEDSPTPEQLVDSLELPTGYQAELVESTIVVKPLPAFNHQATIVRINRQLNRHDWGTSGNIGVVTPGAAGGLHDLITPSPPLPC